jgi:RHS repeat-associated protein
VTHNGNSTGRKNEGGGIYYYRTRYYVPQIGRFLSEDPVRFRGCINYYTYFLSAGIQNLTALFF